MIMVGAYWLLEALDVAPPAHFSSLVTGDTLDTGISSLLRAALVIPLITLAIWLVFEAVPTAACGRTIGKLIVGLKVLRADTWSEPGVGKSLGRWAVPAALFLVPGFGNLLVALVYASVAWNKQGQGWHDRAAGTVVVRARGDRLHPARTRPEAPDASAPPAAVAPAFGEVATGWTPLETGEEVQLASPGRRLAARGVDWAIGAFAWLMISLLLGPSLPAPDPTTRFYDSIWIGALIVVGLGGCYDIAMIAFRGQTIGKAVAGVRVVRTDNGMDPGAVRSTLRWLTVAAPRLPVVLALTLGGTALVAPALWVGWVLWPIVYASLLWGRDHRGWHDKVADTLVVREAS